MLNPNVHYLCHTCSPRTVPSATTINPNVYSLFIQNPCQHFPSTAASNLNMASSLQTFRLEFCTQSSTIPCMLHVLSITLTMLCEKYELLTFPMLLLLLDLRSSALCLQTPSIFGRHLKLTGTQHEGWGTNWNNRSQLATQNKIRMYNFPNAKTEEIIATHV